MHRFTAQRDLIYEVRYLPTGQHLLTAGGGGIPPYANEPTADYAVQVQVDTGIVGNIDGTGFGGFDMAGIAVSAGSACSSGTLKASHVLGAMGWDAQAAGEVVRVSFGPETNEVEIMRFIEVWCSTAARAQAA